MEEEIPITQPRAAKRILAVVLHGWHAAADNMTDVEAAIRKELGDAVCVFAPPLPYRKIFSFVRAAEITASIIKEIDDRADRFDEIILVGHSLGSVIARRIFLVAQGDVEGFENEKPLDTIARRRWAEKVTRVVMIATFNRGWQISQRLSWLYGIYFNIIGLVGHLLALGSIEPTIFDIRLGAPFIVQTRLHWLAYRRARRAYQRDQDDPIVVQLIGTHDDLISPFDQVDIAVDGTLTTGGPRNVARQRYFLIEMPFTGHDDAIAFHSKENDPAAIEHCDQRRSRFVKALTCTPADLRKHAVDPTLLVDQVASQDMKATDVVFVIHGIRDDGFWTHRIAERIRQTDHAVLEFRGWTPTYGYFAMLPFLLPWVRRQKVEWFMDQYVAAKAQYPAARRFHYVGHSNGTYLAARALEIYPALRLENVYFAGSVVRHNYPWANALGRGAINCLLNVRASADWVVALLPKSVEKIRGFDLGSGGFDGFGAATEIDGAKEPTDKTTGVSGIFQLATFAEGGHGAAIEEIHWQMIAEFIVDGTLPAKADGQGFVSSQSKQLAFWSKLRLGIPLLAALAIIIALGILSPLIDYTVLGRPIPTYCTAASVAGFAIYLWLVRFFVLRF